MGTIFAYFVVNNHVPSKQEVMKKMVKHAPSCVAMPWHRFNNIGVVRFQLEIAWVLDNVNVSSITFGEYIWLTSLKLNTWAHLYYTITFSFKIWFFFSKSMNIPTGYSYISLQSRHTDGEFKEQCIKFSWQSTNSIKRETISDFLVMTITDVCVT